MSKPKVVNHEQWLEARLKLLEEEKKLTRQRDQISQARQSLPWVRIDKSYEFESPQGRESLSELFGSNSQLLVYHFMFGPDWEEGCTSCSFWADNYNGIDIHLSNRDISLVAVSRASVEKIEQYRNRMGWNFKWVSSIGNDFSRDLHVYFDEDEQEKGEMYYNYRQTRFPSSDGPGISVFAKDDAGNVYHTYSCYSRGLDIFNSAYHMMDIVPKGRDEQDFDFSMAWLRRRDQYEG